MSPRSDRAAAGRRRWGAFAVLLGMGGALLVVPRPGASVDDVPEEASAPTPPLAGPVTPPWEAEGGPVRRFVLARVYDPSGKVGMHSWRMSGFGSRAVAPVGGWLGQAFRYSRRRLPDWVEEPLADLGVTPGVLVEPLLVVDPWLAAAAASADHDWAERERRRRWRDFDRTTHTVEERQAFRAQLVRDTPEEAHAAAFAAHADHEAATLVQLDALASVWNGPQAGRAERLRFLARCEDVQAARVLATSFMGPLGIELTAEERGLVAGLRHHEDPVVRGAMGLLEALQAVETWGDALRQAARDCGHEAPLFRWAVLEGTFDGTSWRWAGEGPIPSCLEAARLEIQPEEAVSVDLAVQDMRPASPLR